MKKKKEKWRGGRVDNIKDFRDESRLIKVDVGEYNTENMILFGANMVMARHLLFVIDGLKPGARRALTAIYRAVKNKPTTMSNAVSETMKLHPHGDTSIYDSIILMGQPWKKMNPLIDSLDENYGSAAGFGDKEAAMRYLKTALSEYSLDCFFSDYDEKVVEMKPNFDDNTTEPLYLPAKYPNVFINGGDGMAWGYATEIPTYNVVDLLTYTINLIKDPDGDYGNIVPDSPTGCYIIDDPEIFRKLQYEGFKDEDTRSYTYTMQSVITKDESKHTLTIESFPPQRTTEAFFKGIDEMKESGKLVGCTKVKNECQGEFIKIILCFKPEVNLDEVRESLYSNSLGTRCPFPAQITVIDDKNSFNMSIQRYSVKECLLQWIAYRRDFKRRFYNRKIVEGKKRIHEINEMLRLFNDENYKKMTEIVQYAETEDQLIRDLIDEFDIDTVQAMAVAKMSSFERVKGSKKKLKKKREELIENIKEWMDLVKSTKRIDKQIISELKEGIEKYGEPRRSKIITLSNKNFIPDTKHTIVITANGMIKKLKDSVRSIGAIGKDDSPVEVKKDVSNLDTLLIFDSFGRVHSIPLFTIRGCDLMNHGVPLSTYSKIDNSQVVSVFVMNKDNGLVHPAFHGGGYFLFTTKRGLIKKSAFEEYCNIRASSLGTRLRDDDSLISVKYVNKDTEIVTFTFMGKGLRYNTDTIPETKRNSLGVKIFTVDEYDAVRDTVVISHKDDYLLIVTAKGYGKKIALENLNKQERRKDSNILTGLRDGDMMLYAAGVTNKDKFSAIMKESHFEFDVLDVVEQYKLNKGEKLIPIKRGELVIKLVRR